MTLKKAIEPRGAYKYKPKEINNSSSSRTDMSPLKSITNGELSNSHYNNRSKSVVPQPADADQLYRS
jgi:hypothetical protein